MTGTNDRAVMELREISRPVNDLESLDDLVDYLSQHSIVLLGEASHGNAKEDLGPPAGGP